MIRIIIELPQNYSGWPNKRVKMLKKWLSELSCLLTDGSFMNYTKNVKFEGMDNDKTENATGEEKNH